MHSRPPVQDSGRECHFVGHPNRRDLLQGFSAENAGTGLPVVAGKPYCHRTVTWARAPYPDTCTHTVRR